MRVEAAAEGTSEVSIFPNFQGKTTLHPRCRCLPIAMLFLEIWTTLNVNVRNTSGGATNHDAEDTHNTHSNTDRTHSNDDNQDGTDVTTTTLTTMTTR